MDDVRHPDVEAAPPMTRDEEPAAPNRGRGLVFGVLALVFLGLVVWGVLYWLDARHYESTDDAAIDGHVSQVAPQVSGRVARLLVGDNQLVTAGQVLLQIDPADAQVRLDQVEAQRAQAVAQLEQARATLLVRQADIDQAEANVRVAESDLGQTKQDLARYRAINPRAITKQILDNAASAAGAAQARVDASSHAVGGMRAQLVAARAEIAAAAAAVKTAAANVANAQLQLSYTRPVAPADGRVTRRTVEVGNYVNPGQALLAIVQPARWVTANFKETQLTDMRPGQTVALRVDAFPAAKLTGHVDSVQAGTGSVFSALPAENATGNFVKVVQRQPVKIVFDGDAWRDLALAPGMSVTPTVRVR